MRKPCAGAETPAGPEAPQAEHVGRCTSAENLDCAGDLTTKYRLELPGKGHGRRANIAPRVINGRINGKLARALGGPKSKIERRQIIEPMARADRMCANETEATEPGRNATRSTQ